MVHLTEANQLPPTTNVVHPGIGKKIAHSVTLGLLIQVHLVSDSDKLTCHKPSSHSALRTANGSISLVMGEGSIILTNTITLDIVLIVPSLVYNLLSVNQITVTLKCTVTFWPQFCVFQNILTRKILSYGVRWGNMYYLELTEKRGFNDGSHTSDQK